MKEINQDIHDSEYNRKLIELGEGYLALQKQNLHVELDKLKEGARNLANSSNTNYPQLHEICKKLDSIKF